MTKPDFVKLSQTAAGEGTLRFEYMDPIQIQPNPHNHPPRQIEALKALIYGLMDEPGTVVGWADALIVNDRREEDGWDPTVANPTLINGEARWRMAVVENDTAVPVILNSWTPTQEATILATYDASTGMAEVDQQRLDAITARIDDDRDIISSLLAQRPGEAAALAAVKAKDMGPADTLSFGGWAVPLRAWETQGLETMAEEYEADMGTLSGFIAHLLDNAGHDKPETFS